MIIPAYIVGILICFGIPIGGFLWASKKAPNGKKGMWKAFLLGMAAFFVSQIVIRIPLLNVVLPQFAWYAVLQTNIWAYGIFLGLTAALFEEVARWLVMRFLLKKYQEPSHGLAFGLGHGGIEAVLLVGLNYVVCMIITLMGQGGLLPFTAEAVFFGSWERFSTIFFHVGLSLLVMHGLREKKSGRYLTLAILLHTITDAACVILPNGFGVGVIPIEICLMAVSSAILVLAWRISHIQSK